MLCKSPIPWRILEKTSSMSSRNLVENVSTLRSCDLSGNGGLRLQEYSQTCAALGSLYYSRLHLCLGGVPGQRCPPIGYSDEGLYHIERGIHGAEFAVLERYLPRKIVTQTQLSTNTDPEQSPADNAFLHNFTTALKKSCSQRTKLMGVFTGSQFYHCCSFYLQHLYGNYADADTQLRQKMGERENQEWSVLHRTLPTDAYAKLLRLCEELRRERPALFNTK